MVKSQKSPVDYQALSQELDTILNDLQTGTLGIEEALKQYQRGQEIIVQLEGAIKDAKNTVTKLKTTKLNAEQ